jgi:hypothetical protein
MREGAHAPRLATVAMTKPLACIMYDFAVHEAGLGPELLSGGDYATVRRHAARLVGHLLPVFSCIRKEGKHTRATMAPLPSGDAGGKKPHPLAFTPVNVSVHAYEDCKDQRERGSNGRRKRARPSTRPSARANDPPLDNDSDGSDGGGADGDDDAGSSGGGDILWGGVVVSNRCYNFPQGDPRRVSFGRNPPYEESMCWVLITHAYDSLRWQDLNRGRYIIRDGQAVLGADSPYEHVFRWRDFIAREAEEIVENKRRQRAGCTRLKVSASNAFAMLKITGVDMCRSILSNWSVSSVRARLDAIRAQPGGVEAALCDLPVVAHLGGTMKSKDLASRSVGGLDLRCMLLIELLLAGTPLEPLWTRTGVPAVPEPAVPGGADGLYRRMHEFSQRYPKL